MVTISCFQNPKFGADSPLASRRYAAFSVRNMASGLLILCRPRPASCISTETGYLQRHKWQRYEKGYLGALRFSNFLLVQNTGQLTCGLFISTTYDGKTFPRIATQGLLSDGYPRTAAKDSAKGIERGRMEQSYRACQTGAPRGAAFRLCKVVAQSENFAIRSLQAGNRAGA